MSLKAKVEAVIYAAEEPITLEQLSVLLKDTVLAELAAARENAAMEQSNLAAESDEQTEYPYAADVTCESAVLPELDASVEELNGLEPGPLMPQSRTPLPQAEDAQAIDSFGEDDEPLFAAPIGQAEAAAEESAGVAAPEAVTRKRQPKKSEQELADDKAVRTRLREILGELVADYASEERGMEIRQIAGGFRMATKPQHHDVVRAFAKSLKPPIRLSLAALETLAVIAYKQPVTAPEIADIRGVESASVLGTLLDRKLITTAGRKQVIGRPMQYKTSKDFLLRFGLNDVNELPSMEEFSQLASDATIEIAPVEAPSLFTPEADAGDQGEQASEQTSDLNRVDADPSAAAQASATQVSEAPIPETQPQPEVEPDSSSETGNTLDQ
ncbi:MAG: SMC-Scp complex subunit ScpB [Candidatus Korobacteraceae bacterium]